MPTPGEGRTVDVCAGCEVDCCSHHVLPLSVEDAYAIRIALNLPFEAFATLVPYPNGAPTWPVRLARGKALLALRRRRQSCLFLLRIGGQRRCAIHGVRPMACRLFPFLPDATAQRNAPEGMLAQRVPSECPWCWPRTGQAAAELDRLIVDNARRLDVDTTVLRTWHRQLDLPHQPRSFFRFLDEEMARRAAGDSGPGRWKTSLW
ncbi:MAG: YkgJ family cysteine cluster protein [Pseudomonadota bacterium]